MQNNDNKLTKREALDELWARGYLKYKLDIGQRQMYDLFYNSKHKMMTWLLARRSGKSFTLCVLAIEQCLKQPNSIVKMVSPTKTQLNTNMRPLFKKILEDCPERLRPEFRTKDQMYFFSNGSEIQLAGSDGNHCEKLRGGDSHIWFIDEAGSCDGLDNLVKSILIPTTLMTKGKGVLASTPPKEADHEFIRYIEEAELKGSLVKKTVYDNPRITKQDIDELTVELGGEHTDEFRREMMCELIKSATTSVLPEFTKELEKEVVKEWIKPPFYDAYVSMDLGGIDLTALLFGYYDFRNDKIIIEDEIEFDFSKQDKHLKLLVDEITKKEADLWTNVLTNEVRKPYLRVSDINIIATNEISKISHNQVYFKNTAKDDKESAINNVRILLSHKKIIINPKCVNLIRHLRNVRWASEKNKSTFGRSPDNGHYDFVDALIYFVRNVEFRKNPYPKNYDLNLRRDDAHFSAKFDQQKSDNRTHDVLRSIFKTGSSNNTPANPDIIMKNRKRFF
jgi:hypothetical protein